MTSQRKGPLQSAAQRWDQGPSRGNDASGRIRRVRLEMGAPKRVSYPSNSQAGMHYMQMSCHASAKFSYPRKGARS